MSDQSQHDTFFDEFGDDKRQRRIATEDATEEDILALSQGSQANQKSKPRSYWKRFVKPNRMNEWMKYLSNNPKYYGKSKSIGRSYKKYERRKVYKRPSRRVIKPRTFVTCSCTLSHAKKRVYKSRSKSSKSRR